MVSLLCSSIRTILPAVLNLVTWVRQRVHWDYESEKLQHQVNLNSTRPLAIATPRVDALIVGRHGYFVQRRDR
jgi:hypothetical protein